MFIYLYRSTCVHCAQCTTYILRNMDLHQHLNILTYIYISGYFDNLNPCTIAKMTINKLCNIFAGYDLHILIISKTDRYSTDFFII